MATYETITFDLGLESDYFKLPAPVTVRDWSYFLVRSRKGVYQLLSNVCPHQAEEVVDWTGVFMCPAHGWRFEYTEGVCVNGPNAKLVGFPVSVEDGHLIAELPND
ncbi:MAG: Rieske (2Fe-2S) protein [Chloroflexota bacterium]|nr:Rieske (2Fe-2S) protein [Chloroflexota bacterium]